MWLTRKHCDDNLWFREYGTGFIGRITLGDINPIFGNGFD